jgi:hypothetical protein
VRNSSGEVCNITKTPDRTDTVRNEHHFGIPYALRHIPVLASCGSRVFSVRIFVQLISGDNVKIDGSVPYDKDASIPGPSTVGETRTQAMVVNSN